MCYNCGCFNPHDNMGHDENITDQTLEHLASHWGKSLEETKKVLFALLQNNDPRLNEDPEVKEMFEKAAKAWGQSVDEAKKNALALLQTQVK